MTNFLPILVDKIQLIDLLCKHLRPTDIFLLVCVCVFLSRGLSHNGSPELHAYVQYANFKDAQNVCARLQQPFLHCLSQGGRLSISTHTILVQPIHMRQQIRN